MKGRRGVGAALRKHAEVCVTLIAVALLTALIAIWVLSPAGLWAIRDYGLLIAAVVAFPLAFWRSRVAERQSGTAQQSLLNERYQQSAAMLGSDVLAVRLAGIYALQRLAEAHPQQYHIQIIQVFCAFARDPTSDKSEAAERAMADAGTELRQDVQAVITAISTCHARQLELEKDEEFRLDLRKAQLIRAHLVDANLSGADLSGANLLGSTLSIADLSKTIFSDAQLAGAFLWHASTSGARFWGAELPNAHLDDANLSGAQFSMSDGVSPARGLTQSQLDTARADPKKPPKLDGVLDAVTGKQLVWRDKAPGENT